MKVLKNFVILLAAATPVFAQSVDQRQAELHQAAELLHSQTPRVGDIAEAMEHFKAYAKLETDQIKLAKVADHLQYVIAVYQARLQVDSVPGDLALMNQTLEFMRTALTGLAREAKSKEFLGSEIGSLLYPAQGEPTPADIDRAAALIEKKYANVKDPNALSDIDEALQTFHVKNLGEGPHSDTPARLLKFGDAMISIRRRNSEIRDKEAADKAQAEQKRIAHEEALSRPPLNANIFAFGKAETPEGDVAMSVGGGAKAADSIFAAPQKAPAAKKSVAKRAALRKASAPGRMAKITGANGRSWTVAREPMDNLVSAITDSESDDTEGMQSVSFKAHVLVSNQKGGTSEGLFEGKIFSSVRRERRFSNVSAFGVPLGQVSYSGGIDGKIIVRGSLLVQGRSIPVRLSYLAVNTESPYAAGGMIQTREGAQPYAVGHEGVGYIWGGGSYSQAIFGWQSSEAQVPSDFLMLEYLDYSQGREIAITRMERSKEGSK
jgi:hypothetical protein